MGQSSRVSQFIQDLIQVHIDALYILLGKEILIIIHMFSVSLLTFILVGITEHGLLRRQVILFLAWTFFLQLLEIAI